MSLTKLWLIPGAVAVASVMTISLWSETGKIEADLTGRAQQLLTEKGMGWAAISFSGRDGTLTGIAPEPGLSGRAAELLEAERGIRKVTDVTTLLAEQKPFTWGIERSGAKISMIGYLPYGLFKSVPDKVASAVEGISLSSSLELARGAPADIEKAVVLAIDIVAMLPDAKIMLIDNQLTISGRLEDGNPAHLALFDALQKKLISSDLGGILLDLQLKQPKAPKIVGQDVGEAATLNGFSIARNEDGVALAGSMPSEEVKARVLDLAYRKFGKGTVKDTLEVREGVKIAGLGYDDYSHVAEASLQAVSRLGQGVAQLTTNGLSLSGGTFYQGALTELEQLLQAALPEGVSLTSELSVVKPGAAVNADKCQTLMRDALKQNTILFDSGKATISADSYGLLDGLIYTAHRCPDSRIQIAGHTDSDGDNATNQLLSERRAGAVVDYLIAAGLDQDRLEPRGFGETEPVASNDTAEGKAKNRRIEFVILTQ